MGAEQRAKLIDRDEKADQVNHRKRTLEEPACQPVIGSLAARERRDEAHTPALSAARAA